MALEASTAVGTGWNTFEGKWIDLGTQASHVPPETFTCIFNEQHGLRTSLGKVPRPVKTEHASAIQAAAAHDRRRFSRER